MCCSDDKPKIELRAHGPSFSVDPFFDRMPTETYNCLDFVREVWQAMTGEDITNRFPGLVGDFHSRKVTQEGVRSSTRLQSPVSPCFVVMQRRGMVPHVGIYLDRRILHLHTRGVEFQPLVVVREYFTSIRYYL